MNRYPGLRRYIVTMPRNLTKGTPGKGGKMRKGGVERWDAFIKDVATAYPKLEVIRWDEAGLLEQLALPGNHEVKALWFDGELTFATVETSWKKTKLRLENRYIADLHAVAQIDTLLTEDLWSPAHLQHTRTNLAEVEAHLASSVSDLRGFDQLTTGRRPPEIDSAIAEASKDISSLLEHARVLSEVLSTGPRDDVADCPSTAGLQRLSAHLETFKKSQQGTYTADHAQRALGAIDSALQAIYGIDTWMRESSTPRVIRGPAGCGKTHASAAAVDALIEQRAPAVLVLAKDHHPAQGLSRVLGETLDTPGWPVGRVLDGLEALALLDHIHRHPDQDDEPGYSRCLLLIDGLEESADSTRWEGILSDLIVELRNRPRIHLVATARPEFLDQIAIPAGLSVAHIEQDGDVDLPGLLRAYASHFDVTVDRVPWLGWALRTPLEIRLFAEEFRGQTVDADQGANANLLTLFRNKLLRLEEEGRRRAGDKAWSAHLGLVPAVLTALSRLTAKASTTRVPDIEVVREVSIADPEYTAQRVRAALSLLHEHGLVDRWIPPTRGLRGPHPEYGLATRHVSDFVLASELAEQALAELESGGPITYPSVLRWRRAAAVLYAARLAERGHFVADVEWHEGPEELKWLHAASLGLLAPAATAARSAEVARWLVESTALNRGILRRLTVPVSRIPHHSLGPRLLDRALRSLPLAERDPIWSVPEDLDGTGPWRGCFESILDDFELSARVDPWDGLPLIAAWACSSVVENRRKRAREMLAVWGASRLADMVRLLEHMSDVDDPQVVDDVVIAALGAAVGSPVDDPALRDLALLVDRLFFAVDASAWTPSIPVRFGARGIVERAALAYPGEFDNELARARPPYSPRGDWPPIDIAEASSHSSVGGDVVSGDLDWYVADGCFRAFAATSATYRDDRPLSIDHRLLGAIDHGALEAPSSLTERRRAAQEASKQERKAQQQQDRATHAELMEALRSWHRERTGDSEASSLTDSELFDWAIKQAELESEERESREPANSELESEGRESREPAHSDEFRALVEHAAATTGLDRPTPKAIRNGMIAHLVKSWGWSTAEFSRYDWDNPPAVVDDAIAQRHGSGASHGSRSAVAQFREKYVWAAVDRVAGSLADRLPVWSNDTGEWVRLTNLDGLGNSVPDPLPATVEGDGREQAQLGAWTPVDVLTEQFADETDLAKRAERWITTAELPDPRTFVGGPAEGWDEAATLAFSHYRRGHQCCVDQLVQVRAYALDPTDRPLLRRDGPYTIGTIYEHAAWIEEGVYASPALACWAPWLTWRGQDQGYNSFDEEGNIQRVRIEAMVGSLTARFEGEWPQEPHVWMPSPRLRTGLGVAGMRGGRWLRSYTNRHGNAVAVERDVPPKSYSFDHHYLVTEKQKFTDIVAKMGLVPAWVVRVYREATPALFMHGHSHELRPGLKHRSRDTVWLVVGPADRDDLEVIKIADTIEPFASGAATPTSGSAE